MTDLVLIEALLRTGRAVALVTGLLVAVDAVGVLIGSSERPPHNPKANAGAWLVAGVSSAIAAAWALIGWYGVVGPSQPPPMQWPFVVLWWGTATAFTIRASYRAARPRMVVLAAVLIALFGLALAIMDAHP